MLGLLKPRWKNTDAKVREQAALRLDKEPILIQLALGDVAEAVRLAAVKSLKSPEALAHIALEGACERSRTLALTRLDDDPASIEALFADPSCDSFLLQTILSKYPKSLTPDSLLACGKKQKSEPLRIAIAQHLPPSDAIHQLLFPGDSDQTKISLLPKIQHQETLRQLASASENLPVRLAALSRISDATFLLSIAREEPEADLRFAALSQLPVDTPELARLFDAEDTPRCRIAIASKLTDENQLLQIFHSEASRETRTAIAKRFQQAEHLLALAEDPHIEFEIRQDLVSRIQSAADLSLIAQTSDDPRLRLAALSRIEDTDTLENISKTTANPALRWAASRRLEQADLEAFWRIDSPNLVETLCKEETDPSLAPYLLRRIDSRHTIDEIANGTFPSSPAAQQKRDLPVGPHGIQFTPIPGRPYEITSFFLTRQEVSAILGYSNHFKEPLTDQMPALNLSHSEVQTICQALNQIDPLDYRLPTFDEWLHACKLAPNFQPATSPEESDAASKLLPPRIHLDATGPRSRIHAYTDSIGLLDPIGNLLTLLADDSISPELVARLTPTSSLSRAAKGQATDPSQFAFAAGNHWGESRLTPGRLERFLWLSNENPECQDKVGIRLLRDRTQPATTSTKYRLLLDPHPREGYDLEEVIKTAARNLILPPKKVKAFFEVAPIEVLGTTDYAHACNQRRCWNRSGARVTIE